MGLVLASRSLFRESDISSSETEQGLAAIGVWGVGVYEPCGFNGRMER
jgi:hypothetical protein